MLNIPLYSLLNLMLHDIEIADALVVDDATDSLSKDVGHGQLLDLGAALGVGY